MLEAVNFTKNNSIVGLIQGFDRKFQKKNTFPNKVSEQLYLKPFSEQIIYLKIIFLFTYIRFIHFLVTFVALKANTSHKSTPIK